MINTDLDSDYPYCTIKHCFLLILETLVNATYTIMAASSGEVSSYVIFILMVHSIFGIDTKNNNQWYSSMFYIKNKF